MAGSMEVSCLQDYRTTGPAGLGWDGDDADGSLAILAADLAGIAADPPETGIAAIAIATDKLKGEVVAAGDQRLATVEEGEGVEA